MASVKHLGPFIQALTKEKWLAKIFRSAAFFHTQAQNNYFKVFFIKYLGEMLTFISVA